MKIVKGRIIFTDNKSMSEIDAQKHINTILFQKNIKKIRVDINYIKETTNDIK